MEWRPTLAQLRVPRETMAFPRVATLAGETLAGVVIFSVHGVVLFVLGRSALTDPFVGPRVFCGVFAAVYLLLLVWPTVSAARAVRVMVIRGGVVRWHGVLRRSVELKPPLRLSRPDVPVVRHTFTSRGGPVLRIRDARGVEVETFRWSSNAIDEAVDTLHRLGMVEAGEERPRESPRAER